MTVAFDLPEGHTHEYSIWCYKNLFVPGEPKTWCIFDHSHGNIKYSTKKIIFYSEEDAMAFRLRFGI